MDLTKRLLQISYLCQKLRSYLFQKFHIYVKNLLFVSKPTYLSQKFHTMIMSKKVVIDFKN